MDIELNKHKIELQDREIVCTECDTSERIPDIFYRDSGKLVRKYKYYALGKVTQDECEEAIPEGVTAIIEGDQDLSGAAITANDVINVQTSGQWQAAYDADTTQIKLPNGDVITTKK